MYCTFSKNAQSSGRRCERDQAGTGVVVARHGFPLSLTTKQIEKHFGILRAVFLKYKSAPISRKRSVTPGFLGATRRVFTSCTDVSKTRFFSRPVLKKNKKNPKIRGREVLVRDVRERRAIYRQKRALTTSSTPYPAHPYDFRFRGAPRKTGNLVSGDLFPGEYLGNKIDDPGFWALIEAPHREEQVPKPKIFSWPVPENRKPETTWPRVPVPGPRTTRDTSGDTGAEGEPKTVYRSPLRLVVPARGSKT
ncbi:hypothetical protein EVAR_90913_1 [Eumeta japonica]|uniref:Uncharacterized protein n=1 Tax=Eumeta variegata TaxID=151549 RepID=A0A4C2A3S9_EUMVA|nr:hypothetical protein EVAR_90913_1 [Eumeta japonica]